ncbi:uncharacterized protein LOC111245514 isoform X1 [Varroa destructor]|uniref:Myotubularin phosphatase domain-containing protein n=1 Tax=Varroa destructor TaxID=109461 RepID=A0A7M7JC24_VARDE|nr:uncharacterized protein LOC111245514 isoform X1 [Varroa destructor]
MLSLPRCRPFYCCCFTILHPGILAFHTILRMYECWIGSMRRSIRWDLCSSPQRTSFSMTLNDAARPGCFTCIYSNTISTFRCSAKSMEKQALTTSGCPLVVRSKNFLSVTFLIPAERQCHDIYQSLLQLSQSVHVHQLYCFHYTACSEDLPKTFGWDFFSLEEEFQRQGVPNKQWIKSDINSNYQVNENCQMLAAYRLLQLTSYWLFEVFIDLR